MGVFDRFVKKSGTGAMGVNKYNDPGLVAKTIGFEPRAHEIAQTTAKGIGEGGAMPYGIDVSMRPGDGAGSPVLKSWTETTSRPAIMQPYMATDTGAKLPIFPFPLIMIYELADNIDALRIPIETLNRESFKNGMEVVERFQYKCLNCGKEFKYKPEGNTNPHPGGDKKKAEDDKVSTSEGKGKKEQGVKCDSCESTDLVRPDPTHRKILEGLYRHPINNNNQTLIDVGRMLERDLEVADAGYLLLMKNYHINDDTGEIDDYEIKEALRIDPPQVAMIADSDARIGFDDKRIPVYICPKYEHRDKRLTEPFCKRHPVPVRALRAIMEVSSIYSIGIPQPKRVIYGEGEVIWKAGKYKPGMIYGYSPIYAVWSKVMALSHMDEYIRKYFDKMRPPRGLLVIASRNYETFRKSWSALEQRAIEDPYMIHPLMVESEKGGKNMAQWLDFTGSLKELQFVEIRKELRQIIGAQYGVLPLYYGELAAGWANEGLQVTITNRAIKFAQDFLRDNFFDRLAEELGIDDWIIQLKEGEEADELRDKEIEARDIANHAQLQQMGFAVERTHQGEWKVAKVPDFSQMPMLDSGQQSSDSKGGAGKGRGPGKAGSTDKTPARQGAPHNKRPSDSGSVGQGHPSPGGKQSGVFNQSGKSDSSVPHSKEFWMETLVDKQGMTVDDAGEMINSWPSLERKSGTLYMANTVEEDPTPAKIGRPPTKKKTKYITLD